MNDTDVDRIIGNANPVPHSATGDLTPAETELCEAIMSLPTLTPNDAVDPSATVTQSSRRRPRARVAAAITIPLVAVAGIAAAAGLIPSAVTDRFDGLSDRSGGEFPIDSDQASVVASAEAGGYRVELWTAPTGGRDCLYIRSMWQLDAATPAENGPVGCYDALPIVVDPTDALPDGSDLLGVLDVFPLGNPATSGGVAVGPVATAITGAADATVGSIDIELADGQHVTVDTDPDGWFAEVLDTDATQPDANGVLNNPPRTVTLRDRQGDLVATLTSWSQLQAVAINVNE